MPIGFRRGETVRAKQNILFWVFLMSLQVLPFNNCAPTSGSDSNSASKSQSLVNQTTGGGYNGSGFSGKLSYLHYTLAPLCSTATDVPESVINFDVNKIEYVENQCGTSTSTTISNNDLFMNSYDPFYVVYNDEVFVDASIVATPGQGYRSTVLSFCYNSTYKDADKGTVGFDFALRQDSHYVQGTGWDVTSFGHAIYGHGAGTPYEEEIPGGVRDNANGVPPFIAASGNFRVNYGKKTSPTRGPATATLENGTKVNMDCYYLIIKSGAGN
jgi:hypothetical protein